MHPIMNGVKGRGRGNEGGKRKMGADGGGWQKEKSNNKDVFEEQCFLQEEL